ncbi:hypothetical protein BDR22DRAFT_817885 [Usnea florida]
MADLVIKKRPVVLRLAELQDYPTLDDRYAATLPFKGGAAKCDCLSMWEPRKCSCIPTPSVRAKCIKRTGERWAWFSSARDLDNTYGERLGTLHYLPWEIRQIIIEMLLFGGFSYRGYAFARDLFVTGVLDPFTMYRHHYDSPYGLWHASSSTRSEMEQYYLSKTSFRFENPEELIMFADQLSIFQWSLLRLITLEVSKTWQSNSSLKDWISACARLPPCLNSVNISLWGYNLLSREIHGHWFIVKSCLTWDPHYYDLELGQSTFIDTLAKLAHRVAAKAKIGSEPTREDYEEEKSKSIQPLLLGDLDPWSKSFLSWWEEKTKIDFEGDETYNKAA